MSIAVDQTWSPDQSKVAFNEWLYGGWVIAPGPIRVYDTMTNIIDTLGNGNLDVNDPEAYLAVSPIIWIGGSSGTDEIQVSYNAHWNLLGLPLEVEDTLYSDLYPESI